MEEIQNKEDYYGEPLLEYVVKLTDSFFPSYDEEGFYASSMPDLFGNRYVKGIVKPIGLDKYLDNKLEILDTLDAFEIDASKFWYLCLFLKDYIKGQTINAIKTKPTHRKELSNLLAELDKMQPVLEYNHILTAKKDGELTFKVEGGKKIKITEKATLAFINVALSTFLKEAKNNSLLDRATLDAKETTRLPLVYQIHLFNKYLSWFLKPIIAKKGVKASKDKSFLISKMIYVLGISDDSKFIMEYKDNGDKLNHLKNILSRYKDIEIPTFNSIYGYFQAQLNTLFLECYFLLIFCNLLIALVYLICFDYKRNFAPEKTSLVLSTTAKATSEELK